MKQRKWALCLLLCAVLPLLLSGCAGNAETLDPVNTQNPKMTPPAGQKAEVSWPKDKLKLDENGVPTLSVYVVSDKKKTDMDIERYVQGVMAGEMKNDWPLEALKAQAILARTFVLKFVEEKSSKYEGADVSTDIEEAQAYDASAVNDRVKEAVKETEGLVLSSQGQLPYAWFHAHSGGTTALAKEGLGWDKEEPPYTHVVESHEPKPEAVSASTMLKEATDWKASFSLKDFEMACKKAGQEVTLGEGSKLAVGERGKSGRAITLVCGDQTVDAAELRIALGSAKMRSTLLTELTISGDQVLMEGKGYGHGVGMSQWGAYQMAEDGKSAEEIVKHYFQNVEVAKLW